MNNSINIDQWSVEQYLRGIDDCPCGRTHTTSILGAAIGENAIASLPDLLSKANATNVFVVVDPNTIEAGADALKYLTRHTLHVLSDNEPVPDEHTIGDIMMGFDSACDFILGIGSGVINDLCRYVSFVTRREFGIVATAPSMDGFASTVAPLIRRSMKTTYITHAPAFIIGDTRILMNAPKRLIAAGYADVLGKINSLSDWKIASLVVGEYYCPFTAEVMRLALDRAMSLAAGIASGDPNAVTRLMEALVIAGVAMSYAGYSRPASGFEHHLAHMWEMRFLDNGRKLIPHGVKVGIGTIAALDLASKLSLKLAAADFDIERAAANDTFEGSLYESEMARAFGSASNGVIELERATRKNSREKRNARLRGLEANMGEIKRVLQGLPSSQFAADALRATDSPISAREIGLTRSEVVDALMYAKEVRDRFTIQQLAWDVGLLPKVAEELADGIV